MNKYIIITCVKNEADVIEKTLKSVVNQTFLPIEWLIIDDNSDDETLKIVQNFSKDYKWIRSLKNDKINLSEKGARIASIVNYYLNKIVNKDYKFFSKLDGDVELPNDFFEKMIHQFLNEEELGIASGSLIYDGKKEKVIYKDLTRGATKFYRKECFIQIGGLQKTTGWDTLDNITAQTKGWRTRVLDIEFEHLEEEGLSQGFFNKYYHSGMYYGKIPYHSWYFLLKVIYRIFDKPVIISSIIYCLGYIKTRFITRERPFPKEVSDYFRSKQKLLLKEALKNYIG